MLSVPDIAIIGAVALLVFGPEQLPRVARKFGSVMRDVQNTSQQFIREMERAADEFEPPSDRPHLEAVPSSYEEPPVEPEHPEYEPTLPGLETPQTPTEPVAKKPEPAEF